jgi:dienelactone hydrolase
MTRPGELTAALALTAAILSGCGATRSGPSITTSGQGGFSEQIPITLSKPDGPGPFPAVVIVHDCSGLGPRSSGAPARWARELLAQGYVVLVPDSFTTRGFPDGVCTVTSTRGIDVSPERRAHDAYAALAHLRRRPYVDGSRVGLMGGSHGGSTTLAAMTAPSSDREPPARDSARFVAAVALYPRCTTRAGALRGDASGVYRPLAPVLILIGEKDDWTPAEPCRQLTETAQRAGYPVTIKIYPGAHHSFDSHNPVRYVEARNNPSSPTGRGATTGGDPGAWADSIREVAAFFGRYLK